MKKMDEIINKIHCADSAEFLREIPDKSVDMVLTSPPYNFGIDYNSTDDSIPWEEYFSKLQSVMAECVRVLKSGGRMVVNIQPRFSDYIPTHHIISQKIMEMGLLWKGEILWEKNNYNCNFTTWGSWKSPSSPYLKYTWEFIEIFCKDTLRHDGDRDDIDITGEEFKKFVYAKWSMAPEHNMKKYGHDAMFPEELAYRALKLFSYRNDVVLDPFNGCGTTSKVCRDLGRRFIGVDIDPIYCEKARMRLTDPEEVLRERPKFGFQFGGKS